MIDPLMIQRLWLVPVGFIIGAYGTLIGAGGGFVLVPMLLLFYPEESPEVITSISLAVVFFNALSGSCAYARLKRIDFRSGLLFAAATIPGASLGAFTTSVIPRPFFDGLLSILMIAASLFLIFHSDRKDPRNPNDLRNCVTRRLTDADGITHTFSFSPKAGMGISASIGYISSALGIGGGIIDVPALVHILNFPVHIATATSQFMVMTMALTGSVVHVATGAFHHGIRRTIALSIGVLLGAQLGAVLSRRVKGPWIIRALALALGLVGVRILLRFVT